MGDDVETMEINNSCHHNQSLNCLHGVKILLPPCDAMNAGLSRLRCSLTSCSPPKVIPPVKASPVTDRVQPSSKKKKNRRRSYRGSTRRKDENVPA
ncbi:Hypothetical protein NTJ_02495 [Nesidiocoris tenuis]|uniref:Uncharacterized protein n=1 Tax=Nesidiocoris tenuis TaxID=355587 RepID=A0ABN7AEL1_9HEMI|nr:Hypothetical protein NTJ_02495 [Nesidiocoris tenuis]